MLTNWRNLKAEYLPNEFLAQMVVCKTPENRRRRIRREQMPYRNTKAPNPNSRSLIPRTLGQHILKRQSVNEKGIFLNLCIIIIIIVIILTPYSKENFNYFLLLILISFFKLKFEFEFN
jgi:hypothetical protein